MDKVKQVAERIKELRQITGKTPEDMAKATGKSLADYLKAEEGEKDYSFTFLFKCASAFGIDVSELVSGESPRLRTYQLVRKGAGEMLPEKREFTYYNLNFLKKDKIAQPYFVTAKYRKEFENAPVATTAHEGEEFDYVLRGTLKIQIGEYTEILNEGDSITYDSAKEHGMVAVGGDCDFIAVVVPPKGKASGEITGHPQTADAPVRYVYDNKPVYEKFIKVRENEKGGLEHIEFVHKRDFNFAFDVVDELGETKPHKLAMLWISKDKEERRFTFRDMKENSARAANYFKSLGVGKGDRVMLVLKRHHQFWSAILGLHKLGAVAIPATNLLTAKDFAYRFNAAGVKAIVVTSDGDVSDHVLEALPASPTVQTLMMTTDVGRGVRVAPKKGFLNYDEGLAAASPVFNKPKGSDGVNSETDPMLMYFTSGTTGYPKIANQPYSYALGHFVTAKYWHHVNPDGLHFTISETGWAKSVWGKLYGQWLCEGAFLTYDFDKFDTKDLLGLFAQHKITTFCAPPTMYRFFIKEDLKSFDLSSLQHATIAGEALNPEVFEQFYAGTGLKLMEGYGQTEATLLVGNLIGMEPKPGSMGKANPQYQVDSLGADGESAKIGEVGEIIVRTDVKPTGLYNGYYGDEEKTLAVWNNNIYHTGDMAWKDEDGYLWYVGRTDDLIKSSGYRIGPFEIESVIMELPYVMECAVTGVPDPEGIRGHLVKASIVLVKDKEPADELKKEIQDYVKNHTAPYKYPRIVDFVKELPKTISGKIRRSELR